MDSRANNFDLSSLWGVFVSVGNKKALGKIYAHYYDDLFNYGLRYTRDYQIIEGSIQNLFSNLLRTRENLPQVTNLAGYIFKGFRRQLFVDLHKSKRLDYCGSLPEENFEYFDSPEDEFIVNEENDHARMILKKCISNLTPKQQEIIYLRFNSDLTYATIANILGIEVESCHKIVYRSIKSLKSELDKLKMNRNLIRDIL